MQICRIITGGSVACLLLVGAISLRDAMAGSIYHSRASEALEAEEARVRAEQARAELAAELAETYRDNAIAQFDQFIITDYLLGSSPPAMDWSTVVDPGQRTMIFDQTRTCIGYAEAGQFFFINQHPEACQL